MSKRTIILTATIFIIIGFAVAVSASLNSTLDKMDITIAEMQSDRKGHGEKVALAAAEFDAATTHDNLIIERLLNKEQEQ